MATQGIKLKDKNNNVLLPVTSSDLVQVKYGENTKILTNLLEENEEIVAAALGDLNDRLDSAASAVHTHTYYAVCDATATTYAKNATTLSDVGTFSLVAGTIVTVRFTNTSKCYANHLTLNVNNTGAFAMYRYFNDSYIRLDDPFIFANQEYTFVFRNNAYYLIETTAFDMSKTCIQVIIGGASDYPAMIALNNFDFQHLQNDMFEIAWACPDTTAHQHSLAQLYGKDSSSADDIFYDFSLVSNLGGKYANHWTDNSVGKVNNIWVSGQSSIIMMFGFANHGKWKLVSNSTRKYLHISDDSTMSWSVFYPADIKTVNTTTTSNNVSENTLSIAQATISYNVNNTNENASTCAVGLVSGAKQNNYNRSSANITTIPTHNTTGLDSASFSSNNKIKLRYETSYGHFVTTFPAPSTTTKNNKYYDFTQPTRTALIYKTTASNSVAYQSTILGNNYYDIDNDEMYYCYGGGMHQYLTSDEIYPHQRKHVVLDGKYLHFAGSDSGDFTGNLTLYNNGLTFSYISETSWQNNGVPPMPQSNSNTLTNLTSTALTTQTVTAQKSKNEAPIKEIVMKYDKIYANGAPTSGTTQKRWFTLNNTSAGSIFYHNLSAEKFYETSDERTKHDIVQLTYYDNQPNIYSFIKNDSDKTSYGFIAQDVEKTHPDLVNIAYGDEYKSVDYNSTLSLLLTRCMERIDELEKKITYLENNANTNS